MEKSIGALPKDSGFFVDTFRFTVHVNTNIPAVAISTLYRYVNLKAENFYNGGGMNFYKQSLISPSGIRIMFDGMENQGIHFQIPDLDNAHMEFDVFEVLEKLESSKTAYSISSVHIAKDFIGKAFTKIYRHYNSGLYLTAYKKKNIHADINPGTHRGTIYFGTRIGLTQFRIYDKAWQLGLNDILWTRIEMQCNKEAAYQALQALRDGTINEYFLGHLRFIQKKVTNTRYAKDSVWWLDMLNNPAERYRFKIPKKETTLARLYQLAPELSAMQSAFGSGIVRACHRQCKAFRVFYA